jgi:hypothetical protein
MILDYLQESHHLHSSMFHIQIDKCLISHSERKDIQARLRPPTLKRANKNDQRLSPYLRWAVIRQL